MCVEEVAQVKCDACCAVVGTGRIGAAEAAVVQRVALKHGRHAAGDQAACVQQTVVSQNVLQ